MGRNVPRHMTQFAVVVHVESVSHEVNIVGSPLMGPY